jgi:single-stranded-DNA-specific exonuclease
MGMPAAASGTRRTRWTIALDEPVGARSLVRRVLSARGLDDPDHARRVLHPSLLHLHEPSTLHGIDTACTRLIEAMRAREPIVIYGDYDVDGISASAILYHMIRHLDPGAPVSTYVPHRLEEGYGLNVEALGELASGGARVVVSVDCGVTAVEQAGHAQSLGLDLIITDHHNPRGDGVLPRALAVVHPRHPEGAYPFHELCGAGVAYKLAWRLAVLHAGREDGKTSEPTRALLLDLLAFAALGTIADMVPLVDENRVLTRFGLSRLRDHRVQGLVELIRASGLDSAKIDTEDVGFRLAPRLNACGRMGHAADAVELFTTASGPRARELASMLHEQNQARQATERRITEQACAMAEASGMTGDASRAIVLRHGEWHPGVVGIVCSRLVDRYARPVLLLCDDGAVCKGSGRSIPAFNLHAGLQACAEHLRTFGGHDAAAGLSVLSDRYEPFAEAFMGHAAERIRPEDLVNELRIDCRAESAELTAQAVAALDALRPFGRGHPAVRLLLSGVRIDREPEVFGAGARHLALRLGSAPSLRTIAWGLGERRDEFRRGMTIDAVLTPKVSSFSGAVEPLLEDWRPSPGSL